MAEQRAPFSEWAILELMGHVRLAGRVSEHNLFGVAMGRIDVPKPDGDGFVTQFFNGSSVYRLTPVSEEIARVAAKSSQPEPIGRWELRALAPPEPAPAEETPAYCDECGTAMTLNDHGVLCNRCRREFEEVDDAEEPKF